jgi:hypothetical protein
MIFLYVLRHYYQHWKHHLDTDIANSLLGQQDTWGRIQITSGAFKSLMCNLNCFPSFWTLVRGFGLKFEPKDENHIEYKSNFSYRAM